METHFFNIIENNIGIIILLCLTLSLVTLDASLYIWTKKIGDKKDIIRNWDLKVKHKNSELEFWESLAEKGNWRAQQIIRHIYAIVTEPSWGALVKLSKRPTFPSGFFTRIEECDEECI